MINENIVKNEKYKKKLKSARLLLESTKPKLAGKVRKSIATSSIAKLSQYFSKNRYRDTTCDNF